MHELFSGYETRALGVREFLERYSTKAAPIVGGEFEDVTRRRDHVLYEVAGHVGPPEVTGDDVAAIHDCMGRTMDAVGGIGIAAPQVGLNLQMCLIGHDPGTCQHRLYREMPGFDRQFFVNPRITAVSTERVLFWHACLSAAEARQPFGRLANYMWLDYEALDEELQPIQGRLEGHASVVFQHEFDHLLGNLYTERAQEFRKPRDLTPSDVASLVATDDAFPLVLADYQIGRRIEEGVDS